MVKQKHYLLLVMKHSQETNDFAIDADVAQGFQDMLEATLPEAVGATLAPFDIEPIFFNNPTSAKIIFFTKFYVCFT